MGRNSYTALKKFDKLCWTPTHPKSGNHSRNSGGGALQIIIFSPHSPPLAMETTVCATIIITKPPTILNRRWSTLGMEL